MTNVDDKFQIGKKKDAYQEHELPKLQCPIEPYSPRCPQVEDMISKDHGTHWKLHLPDRSPLDPYRLWMWDRRGFRQDNWYNAPNDCDEKIEKKFYTPYYQENRHKLIPRSEELTCFWEAHPGRLLKDQIYLDPDRVSESREKSLEEACTRKHLPFKPPSTKKISNKLLMRYRFMANNYRTFDDGYAEDFDH